VGNDPGAWEASIEARLRAMEDRAEILNLEGRYARTWDSGDGAGWADVFTVDGVWEALPAGTQAPANVVRGHAELEAFCTQCAGRVTGLHFLHVNELEVDGDDARSLVYFDFRGTMQPPGAPAEVRHQLVTGHYKVRYRRTADGWRMAYRLEQPVAFASSAWVGGMLDGVF
jgi:uncharacterized protein (TIGR02246 family)